METKLNIEEIKSIIHDACFWAVQREKLRESQKIAKRKMYPDLEVSNSWDEDFTKYVEDLIQNKIKK